MADVEKTLKGLECCHKMGVLGLPSCDKLECPYFEDRLCMSCWLDVLSDALELLKEKQPRVLALEEIQSAEAVWNEWTSVEGYVECMMFNREADDDYVFVDKIGGEIYFEKSYYNDSWRCWNCRPTREQAKAVSWDRT